MFLGDGLVLRALELCRVGGAEWIVQLFEARAEYVLGIIEHGETSLESLAPQIAPGRGRGPHDAVVDDSRAVPHVRHT